MSYSKLDLNGRTAVVIGGTSGIGRAIAHGMAEAGADVVGVGSRRHLEEVFLGVIAQAAPTPITRTSVRFERPIKFMVTCDPSEQCVLTASGCKAHAILERSYPA